MRLYFQPYMGIAGDMTVASLCHLTEISDRDLNKKISSWGIPLKAELREERRGEISGLSLHLEINDKLPQVFLKDIEEILSVINEDEKIKEKALEVFRLLFEAEAEAHGLHPQSVHLHEAGAWDAIFDILTTTWLLEEISPQAISHSPINLGAGTIKTSHGILPVPAPAVSILLKGRKVFSMGPQAELTTPTGAAILKYFAKEGPLPPGKIVGEGRGLGSMDFTGFANFLRVLSIGEGNERGWIYEIETQVDDTTGEVLGALWEKMEKIALDMIFVPAQMKKGRPGILIKVLARPENLREVMNTLLRETSTIGLRYSIKERLELPRKIEEVEVNGEKARVKVSYMAGEITNVAPEFSSCLEIARKFKISLKEACRQILSQWRKR